MSPDPAFEAILSAALQSRRAQNLHRRRQAVHAIDSTHVEIDSRRYINFCSNDYLGLTHHPQVIEAVCASARANGAGSGASGLVCGYSDQHRLGEAALARWKSTEAALLLPSGYQANLAAVQGLAASADAAGRSVRLILDKLSHASLIDAARATGAPFRVIGHNDTTKLARLLERARGDELQVLLTESIFSMDGDAAALEEIIALKRRRPFVLLLDEAHASGVYGAGGAGYAAERGLSAEVDIFIVTLSKAMGLSGGAVCASRAFCESIVNFGRGYVYSTAVPASIAAGAMAAMDVMRNEPQRQARLRRLSRQVRDELAHLGFAFPAGDSPIIPVIVGQAERALAAAGRLREQGLLIQAIRPPTVPPAQSRLRVTLSSDHQDDEIRQLLEALRQVASMC